MPLYIDVHRTLRAVTPKAVAEMRKKDQSMQDKHGVKYLKYWANEKPGRLFCLVEAPSREAAADVHREAHGSTASEIYEVWEGS